MVSVARGWLLEMVPKATGVCERLQEAVDHEAALCEMLPTVPVDGERLSLVVSSALSLGESDVDLVFSKRGVAVSPKESVMLVLLDEVIVIDRVPLEGSVSVRVVVGVRDSLTVEVSDPLSRFSETLSDALPRAVQDIVRVTWDLVSCTECEPRNVGDKLPEDTSVASRDAVVDKLAVVEAEGDGESNAADTEELDSPLEERVGLKVSVRETVTVPLLDALTLLVVVAVASRLLRESSRLRVGEGDPVPVPTVRKLLVEESVGVAVTLRETLTEAVTSAETLQLSVTVSLSAAVMLPPCVSVMEMLSVALGVAVIVLVAVPLSVSKSVEVTVAEDVAL